MTCTFKQWGGHVEIPIMRRTYMGRHYGLYSSDAQMGIVPILGQWRRTDKPAAHMQDVGTMLVRYGVNTTRLVNDAPGWMATYGDQSTLQHHGKMIVVTSPHAWLDLKKGVRSLQSTIALYNFESPRPTWEIFVDGKPAGALPVKAKAAGRITIHDGVSYLGVLPLPATDLGRDAEVVLSEGDTQEFEHRTYKAALVIDSYNLKKDAALPEGTDQKPIDRAVGGFVVEMADVTEYPTFDEFRKHIAAATLETKYDADKALAEVKYVSGKDALEVGAYMTYKEGDTLDKCFAYRRVNGEWPYLAKGIERDSSFAQQGTTGRLAKNGALLRSEPGRMTYLQAWPPAGVFAGYNPLPDPTAWQLETPGGIRVSADGKVGMAHVTVQPKERRLTVEYAVRPADAGQEEMAAAILVFGMKDAAVRLNGQALDGKLKSVKTADGDALVIPLGKDVPADEKLNARYEAAKALLR
jgi:hypothetical protein